MARLLRDRYFWYLVALAVVLGVIIYGHDIILPGWLPSHEEWHLTYMTVGNLVFLASVVIASWQFGVKGGLAVSTTLGLIIVPHFITMAVDLGMVDEAVETGIFIAVGIAFSWLVGTRKRVDEELKSSRKELRDLSTHLQSVREEERKRIALKVHDEIGQELTALKIDLSWLAKRFSKGQELLLDRTKSMLKRIDTTVQTVRQISAQLRPALLDDFGLTAAIEWQAEEFQKLTRIKCEVILNPENITLDEELSTAIFRIFQEILTNVARHAEATKVEVNFSEGASKLVLKVSDNGKGITKKEISHPKSFGLIGIRERVLVLGGEVKFLGIQDRGTTITVSVPLKKENLNAKNPHR